MLVPSTKLRRVKSRKTVILILNYRESRKSFNKLGWKFISTQNYTAYLVQGQKKLIHLMLLLGGF
jgi:hypothetical protein